MYGLNRKGLRASLVASTLIATGFSGSLLAAKKPNVILVMTDDQGYPNLGCVGHPLLQTPNIDNFYKHSVHLTNYHVDPTCAPTRSAVMTGHYSHRAGVWHTILGRSILRRREVTMANVFADSGYKTAIFGKWHLGDNYPYRPQDRGFDKTVILGGGGIMQTPDFWGNDYFDDVYSVNGKPERFKGFCTDVFFSEAIKFIDKNKNKPFFVYLVPNAAHSPFYAPQKYAKHYLGKEYNGITVDKTTANYYGMIENIDDNFGKLVKYLKDNGLYDHTILIFTTDNGPVTKKGIKIYNAGLKGAKGWHYDGGHLVPFFMSYPADNINRPIDIDKVTAHVDLLPTFIDLCGLKNPGIKFDGRSLAKLLKAPETDWPERSLIVENQRVVNPIKYKQMCVMRDQWRLVVNGKKQRYLFNTLKDRGERNDVMKEHPELAKEMLKDYEAFWKDVSADDDLFTRLMIGDSHENPTRLTGQDWIGKKSAWNQWGIHGGRCQNAPAYWAVEVAEDGWYQISLRRWPAEADQPIDAKYVGKQIAINKAQIEIQGQKLEKPVTSKDREVTFRLKLKKGNAKLATLFTGPNGVEVSAYYVYIVRETPDLKKNWQTREGLGLPLAVWPDQPGKDTTE